ncbi:hypothetical protein HY3_02055 [Hyphomonas pacifica]|uniref:Uncharacterized protein n=1 Tax=Hyphomonas pacifica TaxID=1280941 RepID=A0A062TVL2_9PROT|nr:hypothetical protein HY2_02890 [Hyphomonas pacifica]RAN33151.1 hypothetical protein HY3_02055 [Hyphomonas pacifica]
MRNQMGQVFITLVSSENIEADLLGVTILCVINQILFTPVWVPNIREDIPQ